MTVLAERPQSMALVQHASSSLTIQQATEQYNLLVEFTKAVLKKGLDYGEVPGVSKPSLFKPGAEKLSTLYRLRPSFELVTSREDWEGGFFYYHYRCKLTRDGEFMGEAEGSCNTKEKKYRYRNAERLCPVCGKATIIKGKQEFGGGYVCFEKKGGCKAKFKDGDPAIEKQELGQIENPDIYDVLNTVQKMGQKRALVAAVLIACGASEFFTQDVEDLQSVEVEYKVLPEVVQERTQDVTREVAQAAGVQPSSNPDASPEKLAPWHAKLKQVSERLVELGLKSQTVAELKQHKWETSVAGCNAAYAALKRLGEEHAAQQQEMAAQQPVQAPLDIEAGLMDSTVDATQILISPERLRALQTSYGSRLKLAGPEDRHQFAQWFLNLPEPLASTKDLTEEQATVLMDTIGSWEQSDIDQTLTEFRAWQTNGAPF